MESSRSAVYASPSGSPRRPSASSQPRSRSPQRIVHLERETTPGPAATSRTPGHSNAVRGTRAAENKRARKSFSDQRPDRRGRLSVRLWPKLMSSPPAGHETWASSRDCRGSISRAARPHDHRACGSAWMRDRRCETCANIACVAGTPNYFSLGAGNFFLHPRARCACHAHRAR